MADYTYESELVADPFTFQRATNAAVTIYDVNDESESTPLALKDLNGLPLPNPLTSSADAFVPPFVTTSPQVKMSGGGLKVAKPSFQGVRDEAVSAREAAQDAEAAASNSASNAAAAQAAAELAALAAAGGGVALDPTDADTLVFTTKSDGSIAVDPADADALLITA
jgi:hypothetical protein